ncbi:hypothetical protein QTH27_12785 [Clostridium perfringens]|nr:hypothetical protein [Clostridium perfringens]
MSEFARSAAPAASQESGDCLYNVVKVVLEEIDPKTGAVKVASPIKVTIDCDSEIALEPIILEGETKTLRDSKRILARAKEDDLLEGMKLTLTTVKFSPTALALVQGGKVRNGETEHASKIVGYDAPMMSEGGSKTPFKMTAYCENRAGDDIVNYVAFTFWKCAGKPIGLELKKEFFAPKMEVTASENTKIKKPAYSFDYVDKLPVDE